MGLHLSCMVWAGIRAFLGKHLRSHSMAPTLAETVMPTTDLPQCLALHIAQAGRGRRKGTSHHHGHGHAKPGSKQAVREYAGGLLKDDSEEVGDCDGSWGLVCQGGGSCARDGGRLWGLQTICRQRSLPPRACFMPLRAVLLLHTPTGYSLPRLITPGLTPSITGCSGG